jgi:hypothetical protein
MFERTTRTRITEIALWLNAALHGTASVGMALGLGPHTADQPHMARRAAAAGLAGSFMLGFVATRLRQQPGLIVMPLVFVLCNFTTTAYEFLTTREPSSLPPAIPESTFLIVYSLFAGTLLRARRAPSALSEGP